MIQYADIVKDERSKSPIEGAEVFVYTVPANETDEPVLAKLYAADGVTEIGNPLTTNNLGVYSFYNPATELVGDVYVGARLRYRSRLFVGGGYAGAAAASAAVAEASSGPNYADTAQGLAATDNGQAFSVENDGVVTVYLNDNGVAVEQRKIATTAALAAPTGGEMVGANGGGTVQGFIDSLGGDDGAAEVSLKRVEAFSRRRPVSQFIAELPVTPENFRQAGDTVLQRLQRFLDALGDGLYGRLDADYVIPSQLTITDRTRFKLFGDGYSIKLANGAATGYGGSALYIARCSDFEISDLVFDGNRANRVPAEDPAHVVVIDKCNDWKFQRVQANNGTCDGFYIGAGASGSGAGGIVELADVPQRWVMEDCVALSNYRQGCSVIEGMWGTFLRGRYGLTSGLWDAAGSTGPCAGIDCESDHQATWDANRIQHIDFIEVLFDQNQGPGLMLTNIDGTRHFRVIDCKFDRNKKAAIESVADMVEIIRPSITGWDQVDYTAREDAPNKRGCIDIGTGAGLHTIIGPSFADVANGASDVNPCIYIHGGGAPNGFTVEGIRTDGSASKILFSGAPQFTLKNSSIDLSGSTRGYAVETFGADDVITDCFFSRCYNGAVYMGGARPTMRNLIATIRGVVAETQYIFSTIDTTYATMKCLRLHFEAETARYGFGISPSARIEDTWVTNMTTTDSHVFGGAAILRRANYRLDNPFTETAIT